MKNIFVSLNFILVSVNAKTQSAYRFADSIRKAYRIPELAYAVVSSDSVYESTVMGVQEINTNFFATQNDRFHIGSNTKAITSFIAAILIQQGKIKWDTKFFSLFPELKATSKNVYRNITLENLLTFRGKLPGYSYTSKRPNKEDITGSEAEQRYWLAKYFLSQSPMKKQNGLTPSNADYILAGLMLEKASGKSYKELVTSFGKEHNMYFGFNYPNISDTLQPWGHDSVLQPVAPFDNYKLNWLLSAGNINVSLAGYINFIQMQLKGLRGKSDILPQATFDKLIFGLPRFSFGWFNSIDTTNNHHIAFNEGNAGAFITRVTIIKEADRAYVIFTNAATEATSEGITILQKFLEDRYGR